jgi:hypothetical protein
MVFDIFSFIIGIAVGGVAAALSAKFLGFFQKQTKSVEAKIS